MALSELNRLIDNGHAVVLFRNALGSVTAFAVESDHGTIEIAKEDADADGHLTDDFTVEKAMSRLADKLLEIGDYGEAGEV